MSKTIDEKVVEMRFDNANFEQNVKTSMSTLDKLKKSLKLDGASKGLENIQATAKKVNFSGMTNGIDTVNARFSYLQASIQHQLNNIVDSAVNAGKKVAAAFTIDPVKTGFQEYETQINAVQTILANTSHNGTTLNEVNAALDELNTYADKTIYNFTEMTRNIGTFTAAGVDLQTSVESIKGIANLAAVSGSTSQQASTAMYQLSQALAAGKVSLMDWNSVVNAGMGGKVFQDALVRTSELLQTGAKAAIEAEGSFRESLTKGEWLTTEVLTETLKQFAGAYSEADLLAQGFSESQAKEISNLAGTAVDAATKVKTFTQLMDTLKEAAQSGWTQTWELIIGDFEEAKGFYTKISDTLGNIINNMSESRNDLLAGALNTNWEKLIDGLDKLGVDAGTFEEKMASVLEENGADVEALTKEYGSLGKAIEHEFRSGAISSEVLKKAVEELTGEVSGLDSITEELKIGDANDDVRAVQSALKDLGYDIKKFGVDGKLGSETEAAIKAFQEAAGLEVTGIVDEGTIQALQEATEETKSLKDEIFGCIDSIEELGGREKLIKAFGNIWENIVNIFSRVHEAFRDLFPGTTSEQIVGLIDNFLAFTEKIKISEENLDKITNTFKGLFAIIKIISAVVGGSLRFGFTVISKILGVFGLTILDVTSVIGKIIYSFEQWLESGSYIINFFEYLISLIPVAIENIKGWFGELKKFSKISYVMDNIKAIIQMFKNMTDFGFGSEGFMDQVERLPAYFILLGKNLKAVFIDIGKKIKEGFENMFGSSDILDLIFNFISIPLIVRLLGSKIVSSIFGVKSSLISAMFYIGTCIIMGLKNGLSDEAKSVVDSIVNVAKQMINKFCEIFGIHSPSTKAFQWGIDIMKGLILGLIFMVTGAVRTVSDIASKIAQGFSAIFEKVGDALSNIDWLKAFNTLKEGFKKLLPYIPVVAALYFVKKIWDFVSALTNAVDGVAEVVGNFALIEENFAKVLKAYAFDTRMEGLKKFAEAVAILVGCIVVLTLVDQDKMYNALGVVVTLALVLAGLSFALDKLSESSLNIRKEGVNIKSMAPTLIAIGAAMLLLGITAKLIGNMNIEQMIKGFVGLTILFGEIAGFLYICGKVLKGADLKNIDKIGGMMLKLSFAMLLMIVVVKLVSMLDAGEIISGIIFAGAFAIFVRSITAVAKSAGNNVSKVGGMMIKLAIAMGLMVAVVKMVSLLSAGEMIKGGIFALAFAGFVKILVSVTKIGKKQQVAKLGGLLLSISIAMLIMVGVCKLVGMLSAEEMIKGGIFALAFIGFIKLLVSVTKIGKEDKIAQVALTLIAMSFAIAILAGVSVLLGLVDTKQLIKGVTAVTILGLMMAAMIAASKGASKCVGSVLAMAVAIGVISAIMAALTLLDPEKLAVSAASLASVMAAFALAMKSANGVKVNLSSLAIMLLAVGAIAAILGIMAYLNVEPSIQTALALSTLLIALSASVTILSKAGEVSKSAMIAAGVLTGVLVVLALILGVMAGFNVEASIQTATALGVLLLALSASVAILSKAGEVSDSAILAVGKLLGVLGVVALVFATIGGILGSIPGAQEFFERGIPILESIGQALGKFIGGFIGGIGEGICDSLPGMSEDIATFVDNFKNIDQAALDGAKSAVGVIAAIAGANILDAISKFLSFGQDPMETFKDNLVGLVDALSTASSMLQEKPINSEAIQNAADAGMAMTKLQESIEPMFGLAQALTGVKSLATFGADIMMYASCLIAASNALSNKDGSIAINKENITVAAEAGMAMSELQGSIEPLSGLATVLITGVKSLGTFGEDITAYATALKEASAALSNKDGSMAINKENIKAAADAGMAMTKLQDAIEPVSLLAIALRGVKDLGKFGEDIKTYGEALKDANDALTGKDGGSIINTTAIDAAISAGTLMTELQKAIPEEHWFDGKVSLDDFGTKIKSFGDAMSGFSESVSEMDSTKVGSALATAYRILYLTKSIVDIDTSGIDQFKDIASIGETMKKYSKKVADIDTGVVSSSITSAMRLKNFVSSLIGLDNSGIENFKVGSIGKAMKSYAGYVADMKTEVVAKSISAANRLKHFISSLSGLDNSGISKFKLGSIGSALKTYSSSVSSVDPGKISSSITAANRLKSFISSLAGLDTSGVTSFKNAVSSLGKVNLGDAASSLSKSASKFSSVGSNMISSLTRGISSKTSALKSTTSNAVTSMLNIINSKCSAFDTAGVQLMAKLITGILSQQTKVTGAVRVAVSSASSAVRSNYMSMYNAGTYLGSGLVSGINSKKSSVYWAGYALGQMAVRGEKDGQRSNSPSKLTIKAGKWLGEGLVIGINDMASSVYKAGYGLGDSAVSSISSTIAKISDYVSEGIDAEPTIRPIMDLSDIESGMGTIDGMFTKTLSLGSTANLNAISSIRNQRNQNGVNDDVVSAINKLGKNLQNVGNTVNNINGITYDDGSNISQAVEILVNAAKMGRRT